MNKTFLLFKDELLGFAKSWVMVFLWVGLPLVAMGMYYLLPNDMPIGPDVTVVMPASFFIAMLVASLGGTLAAIMIGVDIVNEKTRKVYDLFVIRPIPRGGIVIAKFFAIFLCVSLACILALVCGIGLDVVRGVDISPMMVENSLQAALDATIMVAVSTAGGTIIGVIAPNILTGVLLVWFGSQNLAILPVLPRMMGLPDYNWVGSVISVAIAVLLMVAAVSIFKRREF
jgi:ABC-type transport system involved in multi-copper enzyme maturation permease subunit